MISHEQRETIQLAILQALDAAHPNQQTAKTLLIPLRLSGLASLTEADVVSLLADMVETGLVTQSASPLAQEVKRYARTNAGRVALREAGF
jgi:DNA-binding PadR family transcriptional regulator